MLNDWGENMFESDVALKLKAIHGKIGQIMQQKINEYDLRVGLLHLAILVKKFPEKNQKEIAKEMRFTQGAMSHSVKILIEKDILKQIPLESDMRYNRLVVTEKGNNLIDEYESYITSVYEDIFIGFNQDEFKNLDEYLIRINKNLDGISDINFNKFKEG